MRRRLVIQMVILGFALQLAAYFFLAAPLGLPGGDAHAAAAASPLGRLLAGVGLPSRPWSPAFSEPRLPFAPLIFIGGVMLVFLAAVVYELLPDRES